jgi:hypothetical protein
VSRYHIEKVQALDGLPSAKSESDCNGGSGDGKDIHVDAIHQAGFGARRCKSRKNWMAHQFAPIRSRNTMANRAGDPCSITLQSGRPEQEY